MSGDRVVLKRGAGGASFRDHDVPALPAEVVDTTGAGDAFCAGFLSVWTTDADAAAALRAGASSAASCVAARGARPVP